MQLLECCEGLPEMCYAIAGMLLTGCQGVAMQLLGCCERLSGH